MFFSARRGASDVMFDTEASKLVSKEQNISHQSTVSELDTIWEKHVVLRLLQYLLQTKQTSMPFPLHYNALALFYFYPYLYIMVKWTLPMK